VYFRLGVFERASEQPLLQIPPSIVANSKHLALSLRAAEEGIVLLKNTNNYLPISSNSVPASAYAIVGPNGNAAGTMLGNYQGRPPTITTVCGAFSGSQCQKGCDVNSNEKSGFAAACNAAKSAKQTLVVIGIDQGIEGEGRDRTTIALPGVQGDFIDAMIGCAPQPIVLIVIAGGTVDISKWQASPKVAAILWAGYPGPFGGIALANIIQGKVAPAGRVSQTWYLANYVQQVSMENMEMPPNATTKSPGRGYRYFTGTTIYPFGYGLSYSTFTFKITTSPDTLSLGRVERELSTAPPSTVLQFAPLLTAKALINNTGNVTSDYTALWFITPPNPGQNGSPLKYLADFARVYDLAPGQTATVSFSVNAGHVSEVGLDGQRRARRGSWRLSLGSSVGAVEEGDAVSLLVE